MNKHVLRKNICGFTLLESLLVAVILVVLFAITTQFFIQSSQVWQSTNLESDLRYFARSAIEEMTKNLRLATRTSSDSPSPNLSIPSAPNNFNITFYLPNETNRYNSTGSTLWDTGANNKIIYQYNSTGKTLEKLMGSNTPAVIAYNVVDVEFEDITINNGLNNDELRIILSLQNTTPLKRNITVSLNSIVKLRNK